MWLFGALQKSYWAAHYTLPALLGACHMSTCFNVYAGDQQVAFARIVTDGYLTSMLNDVIVDEKWRGQGIGRWLIGEVIKNGYVRGTICILQARPQNFDLYQKFGFVQVGNMFKRDPR